MLIMTEIHGKTVTIETENPNYKIAITGLDEGIITYLSEAEFQMVKDFRQEQETMKIDNNSISSTEQTVRDIQRLKEYLEKNQILFDAFVVDNAIRCLEHRLNLIKETRIELDDFRRNRFDLNFYQQRASETAIYPGKGTALGLIYCALKLSGEAGEVADNVGKALRDDDIVSQIRERDNQYLTTYFNDMLDSRANKIKLELGDVLWYVSQAAKELGFTLEEIAQANLDKLAARKEKGTLKGSGDDR